MNTQTQTQTQMNYQMNPNRAFIGSSMLPGIIKYSRTMYLSILVLYLILLIIIYIYDPFKIVSTYFDYSLVISILFGFFLCIFLAYYSYEFTNEDEMNIFTGKGSNIINLFVRMFIVVIGLGISAGFMYWIVKSFGEISNEDDYIKIILNMAVVALMFSLVYKFFNVGNYISNIPLFRIIVNTLLYIPCLITDVLDLVVGKSKSKESFDTTSLYLLAAIICVYIIYFFIYPYYSKRDKLQGGKELLNKPIPINVEKNIMSYKEINDMKDNQEGYDYQYGLSLWFYVDAEPASTNVSYSNYTSIVNYGGKPNILYKADTNSLIVVVHLDQISNDMKNNNQLELYGTNDRIVYKTDDLLLQKWNHLIINYSAGTIDIFLNGELVKSSINVVPYMTYDMLTVGENNGLRGSVCNMSYFKEPLKIDAIHNLYNKNKNNTPPIL